MAKKELKTKRKTVCGMDQYEARGKQGRILTAAIPICSLCRLVVPANTHMLIDMPAAPNIINERRPNFSMVKMAIQDAIQYSVPLQAANNLLRNGDRPIFCSKIVAE
jgi:hypothetical protein